MADAAEVQGGGPAFTLCELDWDSRFFGFPICSVEKSSTGCSLEEIGRASAFSRARCCYAMAPSDDHESCWQLERFGFELMDVKLDFEGTSRVATAVAGVRSSRPSDIPTLRAIAASAYGLTRFARDLRFERGLVSELYATWAANSAQGYADEVLVFAPDGDPEGFVTLRREDADVVRIGLIGVQSASRGAGVGRFLVRAALDWAHRRGNPTLRVATQAFNVGAQRLYATEGLYPRNATNCYHRWRAPCGDAESLR